MSGDSLMAQLARCDREIAACERELRAGNTEVHGLLLGLADWQQERRKILEGMACTQTTKTSDRA